MVTIEPVDESRICIQALEGFGGNPNVQVSMLRLDRVHPVISGNKWYKLKHNIEAAVNAGKKSILSFGGAYSNHLIATAAAAYQQGLASIGFVRGEEQQNEVLVSCKACGMDLHFLSREAYAAKTDPVFLATLAERFPDALIIPEGGANEAGEQGAADIARYIGEQFTHVSVSVGTGTTFTGLRRALPDHQALLGFVPMKGGLYLKETIAEKLSPENERNWQLYDRFHFGGFGKINDLVKLFMARFSQQYGFDLDRVYTAKMMVGLEQLISESAFPFGTHLLCIHTGGLTGNETVKLT